LYGLQREHQQVVAAIYDVRKLLRIALGDGQQQAPREFIFTSSSSSSSNANTTTTTTRTMEQNNHPQHQQQLIRVGQNLHLKVGQLINECSMRVAGQSSEFVNSVLEKVVSGCIDGGLQT